MKHRSIIKMFLLFIVTFGIYRLYWLVKTRSEMVKKGQQIPSVWIYIGIYSLVFISFFGIIFSSLNTNKKVVDRWEGCYTVETAGRAQEICAEEDQHNINNGVIEDGSEALQIFFTILFYISVVFILPLVGLWYWKYAKAVDEVTKGKMSFALGMIILLAVPDGFDMLIIQDSFNKLPEPK